VAIGKYFEVCHGYLHLQPACRRWSVILHEMDLLAVRFNNSTLTVLQYRTILQPQPLSQSQLLQYL
jgi:hypothetical protein